MKRLITTIAAAFLIAIAMDASAQTAPTPKSRSTMTVKQKNEVKTKKQGEPKVAADDKQGHVQKNDTGKPSGQTPPVKRNQKRKFKEMKAVKVTEKADKPAAK